MDAELIMNVVEEVMSDEPSAKKEEESKEEEEVAPRIEIKLTEPNVWHVGRVREWKNTWGFLENTQTNDQIFVHALNCLCSDRHTFLRAGMTLKYQEAKRTDSERMCAANVCALDGNPFSFFEKHGESDPFSRQPVNPGVIYKGIVKNYFFRRKFGWIQPVDPEENGEDVPEVLQKDVYVARQDIMAKEFPPGLRSGDQVEFQLYQDDRGFGACNVTGPEGALIDNRLSARKDFEGIVFKGTVEKFRLHGYVFIKPLESLKEYGVWGQDIHADCESINTEQRPARLLENQVVSFKLMKDKHGFHAVDINDENGDPVVVNPEDVQETDDNAEPEERITASEVSFTGVVKEFSWSRGTGWILPDEIPENLQERITHRDGLIHFYRKDLNSSDKVFGILEETQVQFKLYYTYAKAQLGAMEISNIDGSVIENQERPKEHNTLQKGQVSYYDRQKRVLHVRYRGKIHPIPKKHCLILREAEHFLRRGTQVEFLVDRYRGRNYLKQVSFPGRRAKPKDSEIPQNYDSNRGFHPFPTFGNPYQTPYMPPQMQFFNMQMEQQRHGRGGFPQFGGMQNTGFGPYR